LTILVHLYSHSLEGRTVLIMWHNHCRSLFEILTSRF